MIAFIAIALCLSAVCLAAFLAFGVLGIVAVFLLCIAAYELKDEFRRRPR